MNNEQNNIINSAPPSAIDAELEKGFGTAIADQPKLLDELGKQLVTLSLGIPGLFATILKLTRGDESVTLPDKYLIGAFLCWFASLALSLSSLVPRTWSVDPHTIRRAEPAGKGQHLSIEEFFLKSASYKRGLLVLSSLFCFAGICLAALSMFNNP